MNRCPSSFRHPHSDGVRYRFRCRAGNKILLSEGFAAGTTDFRSQIAKIKGARAEVFYLASHLKEASRVLVQSRELGLRVPTVAPIGLLDEELFKLAGPAAEGVYISGPAYSVDSQEQHVRTFVEAFRKRFNDPPNVFAATAYDAMKILGTVMQKVGTDAAAVKDGLYGMKDYPGVSGTTTFDRNGDVVKSARIMVAANGKFLPAMPR